MNRSRRVRPTRTWSGLDLRIPLVCAALALAGCAQGDEGAAESETGAMSQADADARTAPQATAQAPGCWYRSSGDELTGRASPPDSAVAQLGDGIAKVCYSAPSARDREIMGGLVPYDEPWRIGANEATALHVTVPAEIGSVRVEPGVYSLYAIPGASEWTIVVNRAAQRWGIPINDEVRTADIGSFSVTPEQTDHVERMTIGLSSASGGAAEMSVAWEGTRLTFPIRPAGG